MRRSQRLFALSLFLIFLSGFLFLSFQFSQPKERKDKNNLAMQAGEEISTDDGLFGEAHPEFIFEIDSFKFNSYLNEPRIILLQTADSPCCFRLFINYRKLLI